VADYPQVGLQNVDFSGGLGGVFASQQQMDSERERGLAMQGKDLANTYQGLQNDRYGQMTPFELQQKQGEAASAGAKGEIDQGIKQQVMAEKIAKAIQGKSEAELAQLLSESEKQVQKLTGAKARYLQAEKMGQGQQAALAMAQEFGFDMSNPQVQQQLGPILNDPKKVLEVLDGYIEASQMAGKATAAHVAERERQTSINTSHEKVATGNNKASIDVANINAASHKYGADKQAEAKSSEQKLNEQVASHLTILASPTSTPEQKKESQNWMDRYEKLKLAGNPGAFNPQINLDGKVPMRPSPMAEVTNRVNSGTPAAVEPDNTTMATLRTMYKGVDDATLKAAYKKKYGKEPRP